jgi:hypothetical protein
MSTLPKWLFGSSRQAALYPPCLPAGILLVFGSSSRRMDYMPGTQVGTP